MSNKIKHSGVVENVVGDSVQVRIVQTSACAACTVAGYCNASESKAKLVDVYHCDVRGLKVGDAVTVTASTQVAAHALLMGFGLPFVVMVVVLYAVLQLTGREGLAALSSLAALVPYYGVLFLFRNRLREKLAFSIEQ
jgi:sigma-E factor negative regulatory protein RseC